MHRRHQALTQDIVTILTYTPDCIFCAESLSPPALVLSGIPRTLSASIFAFRKLSETARPLRGPLGLVGLALSESM